MCIPISTASFPQKTCSNCGELEKIKKVCNYCGHEYVEKEENVSIGITILFILVVILALLLLVIVGHLIIEDTDLFNLIRKNI